MKNVTITLDEDTARWVRIWAAQQNSSVSRFVGELLRQRMLEDSGYESAMQQYLSKRPIRLRDSDRHLPSREELYDRDVFR